MVLGGPEDIDESDNVDEGDDVDGGDNVAVDSGPP